MSPGWHTGCPTLSFSQQQDQPEDTGRLPSGIQRLQHGHAKIQGSASEVPWAAYRRESLFRKHQLTPTQSKAGAEQTTNCHKSTLSSILVQSSKAYSLLHVTKPSDVQGQPWPEIPMQKPIPNLAESAKKLGFIPTQPLRARGSQTSEASNSSQG